MDAMHADEIRKRSKNKFDTDAQSYEKTQDGKFCSRVYSDIIETVNNIPYQSLLDVGCGTGIILSRLNEKSKLYGIDLSSEMIGRARESLKGKAVLTIGDAEALPWPEETFDAVCCTFSFHHYPNPEKVLSEMNRVLKKGGRLVLADPWMPFPLQPITNFFCRYSKNGDHHLYSKQEMRQLLINNAFDLRDFKHPTNDSFLLTATKTGGADHV
jgi:ubiquinone/menaquinone biosynthesis C-methylase UbiE